MLFGVLQAVMCSVFFEIICIMSSFGRFNFLLNNIKIQLSKSIEITVEF